MVNHTGEWKMFRYQTKENKLIIDKFLSIRGEGQ